MIELYANSGDLDQMLHLIWVCTVCQLPLYGFPDYNVLTLTKKVAKVPLLKFDCHDNDTHVNKV